jgi:thiol-disulfide isomerase/thioredoxin
MIITIYRIGGKTAVATLFFLLFVGCTFRSPFKEPPLPGKAIPLIDADGLNQLLQQQRGKVILIDFWATWCAPCMQLFPHTVEIHKRWADQGLAVVGISLDDPADESTVRRFLAEKEADFSNFISRFGAGAQSVGDFNIEGGALPYLRLYDRRGNQLKSFGGDKPVYPQEIDQAVQEALNQSAVPLVAE